MSQQDVGQLSPGVASGRRRRPPDPVLLERLAETGFLATEFGLHEQAERIFECLGQAEAGQTLTAHCTGHGASPPRPDDAGNRSAA